MVRVVGAVGAVGGVGFREKEGGDEIWWWWDLEKERMVMGFGSGIGRLGGLIY